MVKRAYTYYFDSFRGFRREVWWLALVTLINRAGTMVVPFMSLYLTADVGLTLEQVGWVMSAFGLGSVLGAWLGGKLSDSLGFYPVMFWSLLISGFLFIGLEFVRTFEGFCVAIFLLMVVADTFRPALYVSLRTYSKPENRTRAVTLIRLAINLGFSMGPAVGGIIIASMGYGSLFWIDGITCIAAGTLFIMTLSKKKAREESALVKSTASGSPYRDRPYLLFLLIMTLIGASFLQYFSTVPLFYRDVHHLSEAYIGVLIGMNGFLIFLIEMPLIKYFEHSRFSRYGIMMGSSLILAGSFFVLNLGSWAGVLVIGMLLMTLGEMLNFPFMNRFALDRSERGKTGGYMALFTISFSISHIIGHNAGLHLVDVFGYHATWYIMVATLALAASLVLWLRHMMKAEIMQREATA